MKEKLADIEHHLKRDCGAGRLNDIARLYELCEVGDLQFVAEALKAISRVLAYHRRRCASAGGDGDAGSCGGRQALLAWLRQHNEAYHALLVQLGISSDPHAQVCAVRLVMAAARDEDDEATRSSWGRGGPTDVNSGSFFLLSPERRIQNLLTELLLAQTWSEHVAQCLIEEFVAEFVDIRHFVLSHLKSCLRQAGRGLAEVGAAGDVEVAAAPYTKKRKRSAPFADSMRARGLSIREIFTRVLAIMRGVPEPVSTAKSLAEDEGEEGSGIASIAVLAPACRPRAFFLREYRRLFQDTWVQLLGLHVPLDQCKPVLQFLPVHVIPHLSQPLMLADFYLRAFQSDCIEVSVESLSGLFLLLTKYNMGDPDSLSSSSNEYYAQLYSLMKPDTFRLHRRARFQRLLTASLASGLLPARFAAAFAKKSMRVAIACTEVGTVMWLLAVTYRLIQAHHSHCKFLLHCAVPLSPVAVEHGGRDCEVEGRLPLQSDPFENLARLPAALEQVGRSSLWELKLLRRHHAPAVVTLAKLFERPFFKPTARKLDPELFLDQSAAKVYKQALHAGERQVSRWTARGEKCPLGFEVQEDDLAILVDGWAAALSTGQRRIGPET